MKPNIILFDIDYTLFDTTYYKELVAEKLTAYFPPEEKDKLYPLVEQVYYEARGLGSFHPALFAQIFLRITSKNTIPANDIENILWDKTLLEKALYPETKEVLSKLKKHYTLGVFSSGEPVFQRAKIECIANLFTPEHTHVFPNKDEHLPEVLGNYTHEEIMMVDDFLSILHNAKKTKPSVVCVWMKRGKFAEEETITSENKPDEVITDLYGLLPLVDK